jgi:hypothetical protein
VGAGDTDGCNDGESVGASVTGMPVGDRDGALVELDVGLAVVGSGLGRKLGLVVVGMLVGLTVGTASSGTAATGERVGSSVAGSGSRTTVGANVTGDSLGSSAGMGVGWTVGNKVTGDKVTGDKVTATVGGNVGASAWKTLYGKDSLVNKGVRGNNRLRTEAREAQPVVLGRHSRLTVKSQEKTYWWMEEERQNSNRACFRLVQEGSSHPKDPHTLDWHYRRHYLKCRA